MEHFKQEGYLQPWRLWQRAHHYGYDAGYPELGVMIEMCFVNHEASLASWDYFESGDAPIQALHVAVNFKIVESMFVLHQEVM